MRKLLSVVALILVLGFSSSLSFGNENDAMDWLPRGSMIRIPLHSVAIAANDIFFDLGAVTLSDGHRPQCLLAFNASGTSRVWKGELIATVHWINFTALQYGRYAYEVLGTYSINGVENDGMYMFCFPDAGLTIGEFREYLSKANGSLALP